MTSKTIPAAHVARLLNSAKQIGIEDPGMMNFINDYFGGGRKNNKKSLHLDDIRLMVRFVLNFVEEHAISLPGRIPGISRNDVKVIPSNFTKAEVWRRYRDSCAEGQRIIAQSTFRKLWNQVLSYVVIARPASDLCSVCQDNNFLILRNVNVDEDAKKETLCKQELHLSRATDERSFYRAWCSEAKAVREQLQINTLSKNEPCSREAAFHYSFDFAQQIHYPSNPFQPGPIYFKTPRKCGIFGIHAEAFPQQINYLLDEAVASGKWANVVISLLHHFLSFYGIGETDLRINADNCAGQNNIMLHYLCWRTIIGLHHSTYLHFLMAGHTKFSPDWCFGLFKQKFRKIFVSSLREIEQTVEGSTSESKINRSQLVGDQDGKVIVPMYAWDTLLGGYFKKFVGILEQHHFWFTNQQPGVLFYKGFTDSEEQSIKILKRDINPVDIDPEARPVEIVPAGFSDARKAYLFKEIRPFCKAEERDFVCPNPNSY